MQVVCGNCQLSFQAPDGATGLVCPICRSPLRAPDAAAEPEAGAARQVLDWSGGTLDDLIALLSAPAWSARVEVFPAGGGGAVGEAHVIAGGVSDAIYDGKSTHDALDKLRAVKGSRFRVEPRLPNPSDGDLTFPGPDQGKLEERPLATLMRYCEEFVLTSAIEVWRGSENAKVDYRRGEIVGVTVGGIDAPERLAEVMQWASGNYRLIVPKLTLPETAPKAPAPAVVAPRSTGAASKTIFGMQAIDLAAVSAATEKAKANQAAPSKQPASPAAAPPPAAGRQSSPAVAAANPISARAASAPTAPGGTGSATVTTPASAQGASSARVNPNANPNRTIFGVTAPVLPDAAPPASAAAVSSAKPAAAAAAAAPAATTAPAQASLSVSGKSATPGSQTTADKAAAQRPTVAAAPATAAAEAPRPGKAAAAAAGTQPAPAQAAARAAVGATTTAAAPTAVSETDRTLPNKAEKGDSAETPVWTYVGVGFIFGLAMLGVYRLVMVLAH